MAYLFESLSFTLQGTAARRMSACCASGPPRSTGTPPTTPKVASPCGARSRRFVRAFAAVSRSPVSMPAWCTSPPAKLDVIRAQCTAGLGLVSFTAGDGGSALQPAGWVLVCLFAGRDAGPHTPEAARRTGGPRQGTAELTVLPHGLQECRTCVTFGRAAVVQHGTRMPTWLMAKTAAAAKVQVVYVGEPGELRCRAWPSTRRRTLLCC
jgi:hypothetical protein